MITTLAIDPGLSGTGWVVMIRNRAGKITVLGCEVINPKGKTIEEKTKHIVGELAAQVEKYLVDEIYVEFPAFFGSFGGQTTAKSGALVKLSGLVGAIMFALEAKPVKVNDWKGQLPKDIVIKRIKRVLPNVETKFKVKSHGWDAIGIGLHTLGVEI